MGVDLEIVLCFSVFKLTEVTDLFDSAWPSAEPQAMKPGNSRKRKPNTERTECRLSVSQAVVVSQGRRAPRRTFWQQPWQQPGEQAV